MARTKPSRVVTRASALSLTRSRAKKKDATTVSGNSTPSRDVKTKSKTLHAQSKVQKKKPSKTKLYAVGKKVRVWWPPTRNKKRTDFSGAYWPAKVVDSFEGGYRVEYDNAEREDVSSENVSPSTPPIGFGEEMMHLEKKEFCEVFNASETDPSAWFAQIAEVRDDSYKIYFPFHDSDPEIVAANRVRRARVFDEEQRTWKVVKPGQEWKDGEISSPVELELIEENALPDVLASLTESEETIKTNEKEKCKDIGIIIDGIQNPKADEATESVRQQPQLTSVASVSFQGKESKSRSKRKDPNAPKKPRSSYVFFMEKERKLVKEQDSNLRPQHIMKIVGEKWAKLDSKEKEVYEEMAKEDRARYLAAMKDYIPPEKSEAAAKRIKTDKDMPRKPMTAFMLFSKELRQKLGRDINSSEKSKKISEAWREMNDTEKEKYHAAAKIDKERYDREVAEMEAETLEQAKKQQAVLMKNFAEVTSIGFQPPPLTRPTAPVPVLDPESKKTLEEFDLRKVREQIEGQFLDEAYYLLLDVWREGSQRLGDAIRAYRTHIAGHDQPDWRAFFTGIVGTERTLALLKSSAQMKSSTTGPK